MRTGLIAVMLFTAASASAAESERWIFIGSAPETTYREDMRVQPDDPDSLFLGGVYEANFKVRRQLAGSALPRHPRVLFVGGHMPKDVGDKRWFVVAHRTKNGELSAGENWRWIEDGRLCLWPDDIAELGLEPYFAKATPDEAGRRCIKA